MGLRPILRLQDENLIGCIRHFAALLFSVALAGWASADDLSEKAEKVRVALEAGGYSDIRIDACRLSFSYLLPEVADDANGGRHWIDRKTNLDILNGIVRIRKVAGPSDFYYTYHPGTDRFVEGNALFTLFSVKVAEQFKDVGWPRHIRDQYDPILEIEKIMPDFVGDFESLNLFIYRNDFGAITDSHSSFNPVWPSEREAQHFASALSNYMRANNCGDGQQ